jgi:hypothetical protein
LDLPVNDFMKSLSLLFLLLVLPLSVLAQTKELQVKGIKVGTYYSSVVRKLGKPLSFKKNGEYPCDSGTIRTARYSGLTIDFIESYNNQRLFVARVNITSPRWLVSGITVGANLKDVLVKFVGKLRKENGFKVLGSGNSDGYSYFYFKKNRLVKISWELNPC